MLAELDKGQLVQYNLGFSAAYLMSDEASKNYYCYENGVFLEKPYKIGDKTKYDSYMLTDEQLLNDYGIEIISFEIAPPIKNTFVSVD